MDKGIFIPDITVEMMRKASLEAVETLLVEGEMYDVDMPKWIPCSERLPEKNGKYLITGRQGAVNVLLFEDGRWYGRWGVVAWMPLPGAYMGENDG